MNKRAKLGDVEFTIVESEKPRDSVTITDNPVEKGQDVSDHVKQESSILDLVGLFVGDDAETKLQKLRRYQVEGELLTYIGLEMYSNMGLQTFERNRDKSIANGFYYNITLKQVRLSTAKEVEIVVVDPATKKGSPGASTKVKSSTNNGKQQTQRKMTKPSENQIVGLNDYKASLMAEKNGAPIDKMKSTTRIYKGEVYGGGGGKF